MTQHRTRQRAGMRWLTVVLLVVWGCDHVTPVEQVPDDRKIDFASDTVRVRVGDRVAMVVALTKVDAATVRFVAREPRIASLADDSIVGVAEGAAWIVALSSDNLVRDSALVVVLPDVVVTLLYDSVSVGVGQSHDLGLRYENGDRSDVHVVMGDTTIAALDGESVIGRTPGRTWVEASSISGRSIDRSEISVRSGPTTSVCTVTVVPSVITLTIGESVTLSAYTAGCGTSAKAAFRSAHPEIANVDGYGVLTGYSLGETTVRVWFLPDSTRFAFATVRVK